jgi:hypothetical protein
MTWRAWTRVIRVAVAFVALAPAAAFAQSGIAGIVKDTSGAVLPGVSVEAASPALIEKVRAVVTDAQGAYRILDLRPGTYDITFTLPGFSTVKREALQLPDAFTATVNADLRVGSLEETITVTGESPLVDVQNVQQRQVLDSAMVDALPSMRFVHGYAMLLPNVSGVAFTSTSAQQRKYFTHGGKAADSVVSIDGFSTNKVPGFGSNSSFFMNSALVQEMTVATSAGAPEQIFGGVMTNVIPKEGGNEMSYYFYGNFTNSNLKWDNLDDELAAQGLKEGSYIIKQFDIDPAIGGPIIKDKLWFFGAGENAMANRSRPAFFYNATPLAWVYNRDFNRPAGNKNTDWDWGLRLTYQVSPRNKISAYWDQQIHNYHQRNGDGSTAAPEATNFTEEWPNYVASFVWKSPVTNKLLLDSGASMYVTAIPTSPSRDPGYPVDPWSIISAVDTVDGIRFRSSDDWTQPWDRSGHYRASAAYITGAHAFKVGMTFRYADVGGYGSQNKEYNYRLTAGVPNQITQRIVAVENDQRGVEWGYYFQDQWTRNKLTLNYGFRFDHQREWIPASYNPAGLFVGERRFDKIEDIPNYWDFSPRFGFAYDFFGNGRTAIKATVNRYVGQSLTGISENSNPMSGLAVLSVNRNWTDADKDYEPDCDLTNPLAHGECGIISNLNFGKQNPTNLGYDPALLTGWGQRIYNWEISAQLDQQLTSALSMSVGYFRRIQGGLTVTDNLAVSPADYGHFCVTAPLHKNLPGGGGYQVCDNYDISVAKRGQTQNQTNAAEKYGNNSEMWQGVDVSTSMRLPGGANISGGLSTGRTRIENCAVIDTPTNQYCDRQEPLQTSVKLIARYPLPWYGIELSGTFANVPGQFLTATYVFTNAEIFPSLGRNLSSGANGTATVNLIAPNSVNLPRETQIDFRISKVFSVGKLRAAPSIELNNLLNANGVEGFNGRVNDTYPTPTRTQFGRYAKFNITLNY